MRDNASSDFLEVSQGISLLYLTYINLAMRQDLSLAINVLGSAPFTDIEQLYLDVGSVWNIIASSKSP